MNDNEIMVMIVRVCNFVERSQTSRFIHLSHPRANVRLPHRRHNNDHYNVTTVAKSKPSRDSQQSAAITRKVHLPCRTVETQTFARTGKSSSSFTSSCARLGVSLNQAVPIYGCCCCCLFYCCHSLPRARNGRRFDHEIVPRCNLHMIAAQLEIPTPTTRQWAQACSPDEVLGDMLCAFLFRTDAPQVWGLHMVLLVRKSATHPKMSRIAHARQPSILSRSLYE